MYRGLVFGWSIFDYVWGLSAFVSVIWADRADGEHWPPPSTTNGKGEKDKNKSLLFVDVTLPRGYYPLQGLLRCVLSSLWTRCLIEVALHPRSANEHFWKTDMILERKWDNPPRKSNWFRTCTTQFLSKTSSKMHKRNMCKTPTPSSPHQHQQTSCRLNCGLRMRSPRCVDISKIFVYITHNVMGFELS